MKLAAGGLVRAAAKGCIASTLLACSAQPPSAATPSSAPRRAPATPAAPSGWVPTILAPGATEYLPDFSYAGYRRGEAPLPSRAITHRVGDFGAFPDDGRDDTAALRRALSELQHVEGDVVLGLSAGRYVVSDVLFVERDHLVLRGEGSGEGGTVLELSRPLAELPRAPVITELERYLEKHKKVVDGQPFSPFSWTGGLLWTRLPNGQVTQSAGQAVEGRRGERWLRVRGSLPAASALIELRWFNPFGATSPVLQHIYGLSGAITGKRLAEAERVLTAQLLTVARSEGEMLWFQEPLRHDVRPDWGAAWAPAPPRLREVGFEHFRIELPGVPYAGHHREQGYNAFYLTQLRDGFVRDVAIHNADSAVLSDACERVTVTGIQLSGRAGHYGIHLGDVDGVLVQRFTVDAPFEHSLSFNTGSRGSVFSRGRVRNPRLDQHRGKNHQNLFDAIATVDEQEPSLLFQHGGADYWGPTHGAFNTFWNVTLSLPRHRNDEPARLSGVSDAGPARLVGISANVPVAVDYPRAYQEGIGRGGIGVPSLYEEQLKRRLATYGSTP